MKKADIYEIAIKILGVYFFMTTVIYSFRELLSSIILMNDENIKYSIEEISQVRTYLIILGLYFILVTTLSILFIFRAGFIVRKICSAADYVEDVKLFAERKTIYEIAIVITALIMIVWTLPEFGVKLKNYIQVNSQAGWHGGHDSDFLITSGFKILIGLFLLLSAKSVAGYFGRSGKKLD